MTYRRKQSKSSISDAHSPVGEKSLAGTSSTTETSQSSTESSAHLPSYEAPIEKELRRVKRALQVMSACNQALSQAGSEQELLQQICDLVVELGAYRMAWIGYAEFDEAKTVRPMASAGHEDGYLQALGVTWAKNVAGKGPTGDAIRENKVRVITDIASNPRFAPWRDRALERGYYASIALPLQAAGKCFGALAIYSGQKGSFEDSEVQLLTEMTNSLAYGIAAIRSHQESKRATEALRETEARYRQLVEEVPAISYVAETGAQARFLYVSPQVRTILDYEPAECVSDASFWWNHLNPNDHKLALQEDTWEEGVPLEMEYRMRRKDGREVWVRDEMVILRDPATGKRLTRGMMIDITERRHLEDQLRNAQQLEAVGRLAGGVAHDFNNILSIIMGRSELLLGSAGDDPRVRSGLEQICRAAERAASLTQQLLAFSRKQVLQLKVLDLNESVSDVQKMLSRIIGEDIELIASLHPSLMVVKADPGQIEQVLMNLAVNARDAMPEGGKIIMETSNVQLDAEQARDLELKAGPYVMLKVSDTGHGMDTATQAHIFEPFFTTKPIGKGTGLGLSTVYGIIKQSGGSIGVHSEIGHGTEFRIHLPAAMDFPRKPQAQNIEEKITGGTETILVVEDELELRELTRIFLESYGYKVLAASSTDQAIRIAEISGEAIDLLLTDVIMPGMSGRQLAEKILARRPKTKIIYMTGYTDDMVVQHKVLEPGTNLLQKPFTKFDLAARVRSTLDGK
jgi:two-component system, cell cycle sensor histidine kinase and response regulator CckA